MSDPDRVNPQPAARGYGVNDYDVFYFDADLSWEAEDRVINALRRASDQLGVRIEVRSQARVHLWYPQSGGPYPALGPDR